MTPLRRNDSATRLSARRGRWSRWSAAFGLVAIAVGLGACGDDTDTADRADDPVAVSGVDGIVEYEDLGRNHVEDPVDYPQNPPVGGDHAPVWVNCGMYVDPVPAGMAVHALEHGAVWVAYDPALASDDVDTLAGLTTGNAYLLVSPVSGMESPVVATAWGLQLSLDSPDDERLGDFVTSYAQGPQTPEPGAPCTGGVGS